MNTITITNEQSIFNQLLKIHNESEGALGNNYQDTEIDLDLSYNKKGLLIDVFSSTSCRNEYGGNYYNNNRRHWAWSNVLWLQDIIIRDQFNISLKQY